MNAPSLSPLPSPLVPQGSIPPKGASRSGRVLIIALTVFALHVGGLGLVLLQGCQRDAKTAGTDAASTNLTYAPLAPDTNTAATASQYYNSSSNLPPAATYTPPTNPVATMAATPTNPIAVPAMPAFAEPPTGTVPAAAVETGPMTEYKVASRDTLDGIARKHHIPLKALYEANPNVDPAKLKVGQSLKIPAVPLPTLAVASGGRTATTTATGSATTSAPAAGSYKVKGGDTLTKIAKANGITVAQLRAANNMKTTRISVGQTLKIPARTTAAAPVGTTPQ